MNIIQNNPYRILGVYSNASKREILSSQSRNTAYAKVGKSIPSDNDFVAILGTVRRTTDSVQQAANEIALPQDALKNGLFWFINSSEDTESQLEYFKRVWNNKGQIDLTTAPAPKSGSECFNYAVASLIQSKWNYALLFYLNVIEKESFYDEFKTSFLKKSKVLTPKELGDEIAIELIKNFPKVDWISALQNFPVTVCGKDADIKSRLTNSPIGKSIVQQSKSKVYSALNSLLDEAKNDASRTPAQNLSDANNLENKGKVLLHSLRIVEGSKTTTYNSYADKLANKIANLCISYYNKSENDPERARKVLKLNRFAYRIAEGKLAKDRCKKNLDFILEEVEQLTPAAAIAQEQIINNLINSFDAKNPQLLSDLKDVATGCKAALDDIRAALSSVHEYYIKESTAVAHYIINKIIDIVNAKQKAYNDAPQNNDIVEYKAYTVAVNKAIEIMTLLETFTKDDQCKKRFDDNYKTLKDIRSKQILNPVNTSRLIRHIAESQPNRPLYTPNPPKKKEESNTGCIIAFIITLLIGVLFLIGQCNSDDSNNKNTTPEPSNTQSLNSSSTSQYDNTSSSSDYAENTVDESTYDVVDYNTGDKPYQSYYGKGKYDKRTPNSLTISNGSSTDALVFLVSQSGKKVRHVFIKKNDSYKMSNIPGGTYELKILQGNDWNPERDNGANAPKGGFMKDRAITKTSTYDMLTFPSPSSGQYSEQEMTLYKIENGNVSTEEISQDELY